MLGGQATVAKKHPGHRGAAPGSSAWFQIFSGSRTRMFIFFSWTMEVFWGNLQAFAMATFNGSGCNFATANIVVRVLVWNVWHSRLRGHKSLSSTVEPVDCKTKDWCALRCHGLCSKMATGILYSDCYLSTNIRSLEVLPCYHSFFLNMPFCLIWMFFPRGDSLWLPCHPIEPANHSFFAHQSPPGGSCLTFFKLQTNIGVSFYLFPIHMAILGGSRHTKPSVDNVKKYLLGKASVDELSESGDLEVSAEDQWGILVLFEDLQPKTCSYSVILNIVLTGIFDYSCYLEIMRLPAGSMNSGATNLVSSSSTPTFQFWNQKAGSVNTEIYKAFLKKNLPWVPKEVPFSTLSAFFFRKTHFSMPRGELWANLISHFLKKKMECWDKNQTLTRHSMSFHVLHPTFLQNILPQTVHFTPSNWNHKRSEQVGHLLVCLHCDPHLQSWSPGAKNKMETKG